MIIDLTDTTSSEIASALLKARRNAGSPAMGMVGTIVVVVDEASHHDAMKAANEAGREHPSRVLVAILRPGRGASGLDAEVRVGEGIPGEAVLLRLHGELAKVPGVRGHAAAAARLPRHRLVAGRRAEGSGGGPAGPARSAPGDRRGRDAARVGRLHRAGRGLRARRHRLRVDPADAVAGADGGRPGPVPDEGDGRRGRVREGQPECGSDGRLAAVPARSVPVEQKNSRGPGMTAVRHVHAVGADRADAAGRRGGDVQHAWAAGSAGRVEAPYDVRAAERGAAAARPGRRVREDAGVHGRAGEDAGRRQEGQRETGAEDRGGEGGRRPRKKAAVRYAKNGRGARRRRRRLPEAVAKKAAAEEGATGEEERRRRMQAGGGAVMSARDPGEPDAEALAHAVAARFITRLVDAQSSGRVAQVVLTGGRVAAVVYRAVAESPARSAIDWQRVEFWWGDERFLPDGDPERNETQAREALLTHVDVDPARVHPMPADTGQGAEAAAAAYAAELRGRDGSGDQDGVPTFDVLMLGVGPDGHVASLFPGYPQLDVTDVAAVAVHDSPKPPPTRVSLTFPALDRAREIWFVVSGEDKADAVGSSAETGGDVPAARAKGLDRTLWLLDEAAAQEIPNTIRPPRS